MSDLETAPSYKNAKDYFLVSDIDDRESSRHLSSPPVPQKTTHIIGLNKKPKYRAVSFPCILSDCGREFSTRESLESQ